MNPSRTSALRQVREHRRTKLMLASLLGILLITLGIACARIASPQGWASPVDGDSVLLVSHRDKLYALDPETLVDTQLFPREPNDDDIDTVALYGDPAIAGDRVFIPTHDDRLYAVDFDGVQVWSAPFKADGDLIGGVLFQADPGSFDEEEPPAGVIYFGSDDGSVYAVETDAGIMDWFFETGNGVWSTPALFEGVLYVTSLDGKLYALDADSGDLLWDFGTDAGIAATPLVNEEERLVYFGGFDSTLHAVSIDSEQEVWSIEAANWFWTTPLVANGVLYAGALDHKVFAVDAGTGDPVWQQPFGTEGPVRASPIIAGGVLIVADRDGNVHGIDLETGRDAFNGPLILDDDVFADPLLRVVEDDGKLLETVLIMTTGGDLIEVDPETLRISDTISIGD
jgi:outer membrane protein assembly factor BamB